MSLENIQLPDFLLADLYKDHLIQLENIEVAAKSNTLIGQAESSEKEAVGEKTDIRYLGENKQHVTVIIDEPDAVFIEADDLGFLTNVLNACKLSLGDISIINIHNQSIQHTQIQRELTAKQVLLFGVDTTAIQLPFSVPEFQPHAFAGTNYMKVPALREIKQPGDQAKQLKANLWLNLKKIFNI